MATITTARVQTERVAVSRLWWLGPLAAASSALATVMVRTIAVASFGIPATIEALAPLRVAGASVVGVLAGTLVLAALGRWTRHPLRLFQIIAVAVLVLYSAVPFLALNKAPSRFPGINAQAVWTMEVMHLVAGAITVGMFTRWGREESYRTYSTR